jgi:hypothetical protein
MRETKMKIQKIQRARGTAQVVEHLPKTKGPKLKPQYLQKTTTTKRYRKKSYILYQTLLKDEK